MEDVFADMTAVALNGLIDELLLDAVGRREQLEPVAVQDERQSSKKNDTRTEYGITCSIFGALACCLVTQRSPIFF